MTIVPTMPSPSGVQMPRAARSTCRSLAASDEASSKSTHLQLVAECEVSAYSGRFSANRLTSFPFASYSSIAEVIRRSRSVVRDQTVNA